ncbi:hypothetical protein [Nocardia blacklockiae]|uniref:hypothetical protein n=1 Tax=Nocardia blacklockiae TaxID=480036 RepID=UPI001895ACC9|nr:hypothetical protein [Nocardia blacklockiae]MBF6172487.1 hypothetical protein [Nocardia blacklockiae]
MITKFIAAAVLSTAAVLAAPGLAAAGPCQPGVSTDCTDTPPPPQCQPGVSTDCK